MRGLGGSRRAALTLVVGMVCLYPAIADACLTCAERLLADGKKPEAVRLYKSLNSEDQPKHVRLAATRGVLAAAGKKD